MRPVRTLCLLAALAAAAACAARAHAAPGLLVGVSDDAFETRPAQAFAIAHDLDLGAVRVILRWHGERELDPGALAQLDAATAAAGSTRVVLAVTGERALDAPQTDAQRDAFCAYAADALERYPSVRDVVVWNEPNTSRFWQPQYDAAGRSAAPASYEALLARCWDVLHALRPDANVISSTSARGNDDPDAASSVSHSPVRFLLGVGAAYRASGRDRPILDTVGHHAYAPRSSDPPAARHAGSTVALGDLGKLLGALATAFAGTAQGVPLHCTRSSCPTVWYLESGYQTAPDPARAGLYTGEETDAAPVAESVQAEQLHAGLELAYCQPGVGAYFNFLLADEPGLAGWQSGLLWSDWTPKSGYSAFRQTVAQLDAGEGDCSGGATRAPAAPRPDGPAIVVRVR